MNSVWTKTVELPHFPALDGDLKVDVLIIGGGMAGIMCAYELEQAGMNYALVEADTITSGVTKNTTAKITSQHGLIYEKLEREFGTEYAGRYLKVNELAGQRYREICENIDCNYEVHDAYVYSISHREKLEKEMETLNRLGFDAEFVERTCLPMETQGAIRFKEQAQFDPLQFVAAIAMPLRIYEHTKVTELAEHMAKTEHGTITAENIIVATHFPINNKHGAYFLKMYQRRSYVIALQNAQNVGGMYIDEAQDGLSFRNYKDLLLLGGGGHRTGNKGGNWEELRSFAKKYYPDAKEVSYWATQDCMTLDHVPYIGSYGKKTHGFYVVSGFNKWGMTSSLVAGMLMKDLMLGRYNEYLTVFDPHRTMLRSQLFLNACEATKNLLTISTKRCPHLKCALKWNEAEHTWDCPCHGSRFKANGQLIDNPATDDLPIKK